MSQHFQNVGDWLIGPDNRARLHLKTIKHGLEITLPKVLVSFTGEVRNFAIEWSAHVGNSPVPFEGRLDFVADEQRTDGDFARFLS